jgi:hypothetical protein
MEMRYAERKKKDGFIIQFYGGGSMTQAYLGFKMMMPSLRDERDLKDLVRDIDLIFNEQPT